MAVFIKSIALLQKQTKSTLTEEEAAQIKPELIHMPILINLNPSPNDNVQLWKVIPAPELGHVILEYFGGEFIHLQIDFEDMSGFLMEAGHTII